MESLRTPVFSQRPFLKPEGKAIDLPPRPDTCVGAKASYVCLRGQGADPSMGLSPSQTVGGPGEASYRLSPNPPLPSGAVLAQTQHPGADAKARLGQPVLFP